MAGLALQDKDRLERTPSSLKHSEKARKGIGQDYTPEHPTCEARAGLGGALAEAAEQSALLAIAAGLEEDCPHTHAVLPASKEAAWHHESWAEHKGSTHSNRCSQGRGPRGKEALPGGRRRDWENQALG